MRDMSSEERPILIFESEVDAIAREVAHWPDLETGGDLFGYWTHSGCAVVHYALGPGRASRHERAAFYQDAQHLARHGAELNDRYGLQHVGEWHSHHQLGLNDPSGGDVGTVRRALARYGFKRFALTICTLLVGRNRREPDQVSLNGFLFEADLADTYLTSPWVVLPGTSPVRPMDDRHFSSSRASEPRVALRPRRLTMEDLRAGARRDERPLTDLGAHWYTTPVGQQRLLAEVDAFSRANLSARVSVGEGKVIEVKVAGPDGDTRFTLASDHPATAPEIRWVSSDGEGARHGRADELGLAWSADSTLAALHAALGERRATREEKAEEVSGEVEVERQAGEVTERGGDDDVER
jgi:hypothetical protein